MAKKENSVTHDDEGSKTVLIDEDNHTKLVIIKLKMKKDSLNSAIKYLIAEEKKRNPNLFMVK